MILKLKILYQTLFIFIDFYVNKSGDNQSEDSSSSNSEIRHLDKNRTKPIHHSDSDDISFSLSVSRVIGNRSHSLRMKHAMQPLFRGKYNRLGMYIYKFIF